MTTHSKILGFVGWTLCVGLLGSLVVVSVLWYDGYTSMRGDKFLGYKMKAIRDGKQVRLALAVYAGSNKSAYPDTHYPGLKSANDVFRELFKEGIISDERIFIVPDSVFTVDNNIGAPPSYAEALKPGECHWMLLKGQTDTAHPKTPLLIENALNTNWPPRWEITEPGDKRKKGQAWKRKSCIIVIVRNDGSVTDERLRPDGTLDWHSPPNLDEHGKSWIDHLTPEQIAKLEYWDVEERKP